MPIKKLLASQLINVAFQALSSICFQKSEEMNFLSRFKGSSNSSNENGTAGSAKQRTTRNRSDKSPLRTIQSSLNKLFGSSNSTASFDTPYRPPAANPTLIPAQNDVTAGQTEAQNLMQVQYQQNLNDYKRKLSKNRKESQKKPSKPNKALSITARDNIAYTKSQLMQDLMVTNERRKSKREKDVDKSGKLQSASAHKESKMAAPSSGMSVASEPIMPSHYKRSNLTYLDINSECQQVGQLSLAFPGKSSLPSSHLRYHASTGQLNKDRGFEKQLRQHQELTSHSSQLIISMPQHPLWYSKDNTYTMHAPRNARPVQPYLPPTTMLYPLDSSRYHSQPVVSQMSPGTLQKTAPNDYSVPVVVPPNTQYNRSVSHQELRCSYNKKDINHASNGGEDNQTPPTNPPRKNLRVPLGLQHQFYQPPPRALQKLCDTPDPTYAQTNPTTDSPDGTFKVPRPVGEVKSVHSTRLKQKSHKHEGHDERTRDNVHSRNSDTSIRKIPKKVQRHMPPTFLGESDLEEEGDDDVFLDSDQQFITPVATNNYLLLKKSHQVENHNPRDVCNVSLTDVIKHADQHNAQFEELKTQINDAIRNEISVQDATNHRRARKSRKLNYSETRHSKGEIKRKNESEEHESSSTNNSGLSEPFVSENVPQVVVNSEDTPNVPMTFAAPGERTQQIKDSKIPPHRRLGDQINVSYLLNESDLNLDTSYTANMVKVDKFLQRLDPVTEAYLQQTPSSNDVYPKMKHRKRKTSGETAKDVAKVKDLTQNQEDISIKEIKKLQQVRRRAARNGAPQVQRPITPPSQRPSRRSRNGERCVSAPPKSTEFTVVTEQISDFTTQYDEPSEYVSHDVENIEAESEHFQNLGGIMFV